MTVVLPVFNLCIMRQLRNDWIVRTAICSLALHNGSYMYIYGTKKKKKRFQNGCIYALSLLSEQYAATVFPLAWGCSYIPAVTSQSSTAKSRASAAALPSGQNHGRLATLVSLLTSSTQVLDPGFHQELLKLAGNLFAGNSIKFIENAQVDGGMSSCH